jgi:hypothetical protein
MCGCGAHVANDVACAATARPLQSAGAILSDAQFAALRLMLPARHGDWRLLHDTARDGGVVHTTFHKMCDGKRATCCAH